MSVNGCSGLHSVANLYLSDEELERQEIIRLLDEWEQQVPPSERRDAAKVRKEILAFCDNPQAVQLTLMYCNVASLPSVFDRKPFQRLERLTVCYGKLTTLPDTIGDLCALKHLDLANNELVALPTSIGKLQHLKLLNLANNKLESLPDEIGDLVDLDSFHLSKNQLSKLPDSIGNLRSLSRLSLEKNVLDVLPETLGNLKELKSLTLDSNKLKRLPESIGRLQSLQTLAVSQNQLEELPNSIGGLEKLTYLMLDENELEELPSSIRNLKLLETLSVRKNRLEVLPDVFEDCIALKNLHTDGNRLKSLPDTLKEVKGLQYLSLASNEFEELPDFLGDFEQLRVLSAERNRINALPDEIRNLGNSLVTLNVTHNQLAALPPSIGSLTRLERLWASSNQLVTLPGSLENLQNLQHLAVNENARLAGLPNEVLSLSSKCSFNLCSTSLSEGVRARLHEACNRPDYQGPRIFFSMDDSQAPQQLDAIRTIKALLEEVFSLAEVEPREFPELMSSMTALQREQLKQWLDRLSYTADYKKNQSAQKSLALRICNYLSEAEKNPAFRDILLAVLNDAATTCGDRVALSILHIDVQYRLAQFMKEGDISLLSNFLLKTVWPLALLEKKAKDKVESLRFVDEIEIYLGLPLRLKERLQLDIPIEDMLYFGYSYLTEKDLDDAASFVELQVQDFDERCRFLAERDDWKKALERAAPEKVQKIIQENEKEADACESTEDWEAFERNTKKRWIELTLEMI